MHIDSPPSVPTHGIDLHVCRFVGVPAERLVATWLRRTPEDDWLGPTARRDVGEIVRRSPAETVCRSRVHVLGRTIDVDTRLQRRGEHGWDIMAESPLHGVRGTYGVHAERDASTLEARLRVFGRRRWVRPFLELAQDAVQGRWETTVDARIGKLQATWGLGAPLERLPASL